MFDSLPAVAQPALAIPLALLPLILGAAGGLFGGIGEAISAGNRAATLRGIADTISGGAAGARRGLRNTATRELAGSQAGLQASLAGRGITNTGAGVGAIGDLQATTLAQLSQAINADQLQRDQAVAQIMANGGTFDPAAAALGVIGGTLGGAGTGLGGALPFLGAEGSPLPYPDARHGVGPIGGAISGMSTMAGGRVGDKGNQGLRISGMQGNPLAGGLKNDDRRIYGPMMMARGDDGGPGGVMPKLWAGDLPPHLQNLHLLNTLMGSASGDDRGPGGLMPRLWAG